MIQYEMLCTVVSSIEEAHTLLTCGQCCKDVTDLPGGP